MKYGIAALKAKNYRGSPRHPTQQMAAQGRYGDDTIGHLDTGEVVVPKNLQSPGLMALFAKNARSKGIDPSRYMVGSQSAPRNPSTGAQEFWSSGPGGEGPGSPGSSSSGNGSGQGSPGSAGGPGSEGSDPGVGPGEGPGGPNAPGNFGGNPGDPEDDDQSLDKMYSTVTRDLDPDNTLPDHIQAINAMTAAIANKESDWFGPTDTIDNEEEGEVSRRSFAQRAAAFAINALNPLSMLFSVDIADTKTTDGVNENTISAETDFSDLAGNLFGRAVGGVPGIGALVSEGLDYAFGDGEIGYGDVSLGNLGTGSFVDSAFGTGSESSPSIGTGSFGGNPGGNPSGLGGDAGDGDGYQSPTPTDEFMVASLSPERQKSETVNSILPWFNTGQLPPKREGLLDPSIFGDNYLSDAEIEAQNEDDDLLPWQRRYDTMNGDLLFSDSLYV